MQHDIEKLVVDKNEKFGYGKQIESCRLVPVIVNLIMPKELQELADGAKLRALRPRIAARILKEACGGGLPFSTVGLLTRLHSVNAVSQSGFAL